MTAAGDSVTVQGAAVFDGGDQTGLLSAGALVLNSGLVQSSSTTPNSFVSTGTRVHLTGGQPSTVTFASPGQGTAGSHFQDLFVTAEAPITLVDFVFVDGQLVDQNAGSTQTFAGSNVDLVVGGASIDGFVFDGVRVLVDTLAALTQFDNVTFSNFSDANLQLTVFGRAGEVKALNNVTFTSAPTTLGMYLIVARLGPPTSPFTLNLSGMSPADPGAFLQVQPGAVVNGWP